nr:uncharacterized protein LOC128672202 [Plodia interpunctella]XP_053605161.1 uncharacterized protein LOC128672202 [Plodia interpunctella]
MDDDAKASSKMIFGESAKFGELFREIHFITSKKGYKLLVFEQYTYAQNCKSKNRVSWACSSRCSKKCNAQVALTKSGELEVMNKHHSHPPPIFYINENGEYVRISEKQLDKLKTELKTEIEDMEEQEHFLDNIK